MIGWDVRTSWHCWLDGLGWSCLLLYDTTTSMTMEAQLAFEVIHSENHIPCWQSIRSIDLLDYSEESGNAEDALVNTLQTRHWFIYLRLELLDCDARAHLDGIVSHTWDILYFKLAALRNRLSQIWQCIVQWLDQCFSEASVQTVYHSDKCGFQALGLIRQLGNFLSHLLLLDVDFRSWWAFRSLLSGW